MEALRLTMIEYGIPEQEVDVVVTGLRLTSVEEIKDLNPRLLRNVPKKYHKRIVQLVNAHRSIYDTIWTLYGDY